MKRLLVVAALAGAPHPAMAGCNAWDYVPQDCYQLNELRYRQDALERQQRDAAFQQQLNEQQQRNERFWSALPRY